MAESPILRGWKEISEYLRVHIDTAKRWKDNDGLPISSVNGRVFASKNMVEVWMIKNPAKAAKKAKAMKRGPK